MASLTKTHISKQEEEIEETAIQLRSEDPVVPFEGQCWLNTTQNRFKLRRTGETRVFMEGGIGAAILLPVDGIMNAASSRSYYRESTTPFALTAVAGLVEGVVAYLRVRNPAPRTKGVYTVSTVPGAAIPDQSYFTLNTAADAQKYFVWMSKDGISSAPSVPGRTAIRVNYTAGRKQRTRFTFPAATSITTGDYFTVNTPAGGYYFYLNEDNAGGNPTTDPAVSGKTGVAVAILSGDTAQVIAGKVAAVVNSSGAPVTATVTGTQVDIENNANGAVDISVVKAPANGGVIGITTITYGAAPDTALQVATAVHTAIMATNRFTAPAPTNSVITITDNNFGYATQPVDVTTGFTVQTSTPGSGGYNVTFPAGFVLEDPSTGSFVDGLQTVLFRFFRSGAIVLVTTTRYAVS